MILSHTIRQNVSILRYLVGEISCFEIDAYRVIAPIASNLDFCGRCISILGVADCDIQEI